ncbi:cell division protein SepF [Sediminivirga luteola]|uniref:Cell division protein SepF n=1 Tax=Sediminivirga luteola TaxID=1774748 RepID=A0A8J2XLA5_9MICO|nr:cell division protein SepF [Sediminivirga luteola]GGA21041.1 cell division protein SepF [Sediminivirga luteola]
MASSLHKTMVFLGLSDDDRAQPQGRDYDQYDEAPEMDYEDDYEQYDEAGSEQRPAEVTPLRSAPLPPLDEAPEGELRRIVTIHPTSYNDAKAIGSAFRDGIPVIINLSDMGDADAKRLVDFSAGLIYGLRGSIERVTAKVFLLTPEYIEVGSSDAAEPDAQASFFNQS